MLTCLCPSSFHTVDQGGTLGHAASCCACPVVRRGVLTEKFSCAVSASLMGRPLAGGYL